MYPIILLGSEDKKEPTYCWIHDLNNKVWKGYLFFKQDPIPHFTVFSEFAHDWTGTYYGTKFVSIVFNPVNITSPVMLSSDESKK